LRSKAKSRLIGTLASSILIILIALIAAPTYAGTPSQPHNADAIWVEPNTVTLGTSDIGKTFNVTVSMNMTEPIFSYQFALYYNRTVLKCTNAGYTGAGGAKSNFLEGHTTSSSPPVIDTATTGNGSVLVFETLLGSDSSSANHTGTLTWLEFQVLSVTVPTGGNLTCIFDIARDNKDGGNTWWTDVNANFYTFKNAYNGKAVITPEFSALLILPILMGSTIAAVILSKKLPRKNLK